MSILGPILFRLYANNCILDIKSRMAENFLQLKRDKTEVLIIGYRLRGKKKPLLSLGPLLFVRSDFA